jgi:hypothetical protein
MRGRIGRIALLIFQALWLNVILPGHTRGIITLPGAACPDLGSSCCARSKATQQNGPAKPNRRPGACAVCFFAARLATPDVVDLTPPPLGLVAVLDVPAVQSMPRAAMPLAFDSRGPPAV